VNRDYHGNHDPLSFSLSHIEEEETPTPTPPPLLSPLSCREREIKASSELSQGEEAILGAARPEFTPNLFGAKPLRKPAP